MAVDGANPEGGLGGSTPQVYVAVTRNMGKPKRQPLCSPIDLDKCQIGSPQD